MSSWLCKDVHQPSVVWLIGIGWGEAIWFVGRAATSRVGYERHWVVEANEGLNIEVALELGACYDFLMGFLHLVGVAAVDDVECEGVGLGNGIGTETDMSAIFNVNGKVTYFSRKSFVSERLLVSFKKSLRPTSDFAD